MRKFWLFATLWLATLALTGCNCNCDKATNEDEVLNQRIAFCNEHWGTHSLIHSPTAVYGECAFPSGVTCEDTALESGECNYDVRNGVAKYTRDGVNYTMDAECVADFVDGSISVSYGDEVAEGEAVANEGNEEETTEEVVEEAVEEVAEAE